MPRILPRRIYVKACYIFDKLSVRSKGLLSNETSKQIIQLPQSWSFLVDFYGVIIYRFLLSVSFYLAQPLA